MRRPPTIESIDLPLRPPDVLARWPASRPLLVLSSRAAGPRTPAAGKAAARRGRRRWARWTIFAWPRRWLFDGADPLAELDRAIATTRLEPAALGVGRLPFVGGWVGFLGYELGAVIEPAARVSRDRPSPTPGSRGWPRMAMAWCPQALLFDHACARWYAVGEPDLPTLLHPPIDAGSRDDDPRIGPWTSSLDPDAYCAAVGRTLEYIRNGDVFQANITQRLSAPFTGSTRRLAAVALEQAHAWYGAALELPAGRTIVSLSPELFLELDARERTVRTRPIKGTRPAHVDARELAGSEKDTAELHMIVDLMRNDLGRVCEFGTVRVPAPRTIETHGTVHHGVGEVTGRLRDDVRLADLLRATFPAGSVTGAPKIRAMQIIDELEPVPRGPYCGAIGYVSDAGDACFNVAIRTLLLSGDRDSGRYDRLRGVLDYAVGGGIVADSDPLAEYRESMDKAGVLRLTVERLRRGAAAPGGSRS